MAKGNRAGREHGFSLIELMIAMVATLVISGAVMQLVSAGNGAFRREPEMSDRQQNIRMAMAMIQQDVSAAGLSLPGSMQVFTNNLNSVGVQVPMASSGTKTDELEIIVSTPCSAAEVSSHNGTNIIAEETLPDCYTFPTIVGLWDDSGNFALGYTDGVGHSGQVVQGDHINLPSGVNPINPPGGKFGFDPVHMSLVSLVHYRVQLDTDGTPNLWRSAYGGFDINGQSTWQLVARGVEDLQMQYRNRAGWQNTPGVTTWAIPGAPTAADFDEVIRQVRVTLSARSLAANLQGATKAQSGPTAIRGTLTQDMTPRSALMTLTSATDANNKWY
jgi:prepilin-type N-terminal cleavage/methylation domain-containing protein